MPDGIFSISVELQIMQVFKVDPVHLAEAQKLKAHLEQFGNRARPSTLGLEWRIDCTFTTT